MRSAEKVKDQIREAFASVPYPGETRLRGSDESDEPFAVERDFRGKGDWRTLDPQFIDRSPDGLASALSMFSDEAFRFYLPAFMIADLDGRLKFSDPVFHLTHGLDDASWSERINPRRYRDETWSEYAAERFARFTLEEAAAIVAFLTLRAEQNALDRERIDQALRN